MEKLTLHTVTEASDWHFLTVTFRKKTERTLKSPYYPNIQCCLEASLEKTFFSLNSFPFPTAAEGPDSHSSDLWLGPIRLSWFGFNRSKWSKMQNWVCLVANWTPRKRLLFKMCGHYIQLIIRKGPGNPGSAHKPFWINICTGTMGKWKIKK